MPGPGPAPLPEDPISAGPAGRARGRRRARLRPQQAQVGAGAARERPQRGLMLGRGEDQADLRVVQHVLQLPARAQGPGTVRLTLFLPTGDTLCAPGPSGAAGGERRRRREGQAGVES